MSECGTNSGYKGHKRRGEKACEPCKAATAAYQRELRRTNAKVVRYDRRQRASYQAALRRLREAHQEEFDRLYAEEKDRSVRL
jgi:hypothetical protein